jgi:hypothetical protein
MEEREYVDLLSKLKVLDEQILVTKKQLDNAAKHHLGLLNLTWLGKSQRGSIHQCLDFHMAIKSILFRLKVETMISKTMSYFFIIWVSNLCLFMLKELRLHCWKLV